MKTILISLIWICIFPEYCQGNVLTPLNEPSRCGDWIPYKDEKCFKIATRAGQQTQDDAQIVCESFKEELHRESYPRLITVKTLEEQEFLQNFIFVENGNQDHVWLGLNLQGQEFRWNDGSGTVFANWVNQSLFDEEHRCVQMESGGGVIPMGLWSRVNCKKANLVVCERPQTMSLETLQNMFINYKFDQERKYAAIVKSLTETSEDANSQIAMLKQRNDAADAQVNELKQQITNLQQNPVPVGFIYVEIPGEVEPRILWPQAKWADVSAKYAGLFFRVLGGGSAPFGQVQEATSPRLEQVQYRDVSARPEESNPVDVPPDGTWSRYVYDGGSGARVEDLLFLRFRLSQAEVRPRNHAVKVWQRVE